MIDNKLVGQRIVLRCSNNLSFAGIVEDIIGKGGKNYLWVVTSEESGFGVLCPENFIEQIIPIDIKSDREDM